MKPLECVLAFTLLLCLPALAGEIHIAPDGDDAGPGNASQPYGSLGFAMDALRKTDAPRVLVMHGGTYRLAAPIVFTARDSGLIVRAAEGESPILSGSRLVLGWQEGDGGIWHAKVNADNMRQLFVNGVRAVRARGECPAGAERWGDLEYIDAEAGYTFPDAAMADWRNPGDIEFGDYSSWAHMICKVERIAKGDDGKAVVSMLQPWFYLACRKEGRQFESPDYIENALELLDEPGEFYFDRPERTLYYLPRDGEDMKTAEAVVPVLETLVLLKGTPDEPVENVRFEGITFAEATWLQPNLIGHADVQANFTIGDTNLYARDGSTINVHNEYLKSPANVVFESAHGCAVVGCTFTRLGGAGLDLARGCKNNSVERCAFFDISGSGIQIGDVLAPDHHPRDPRLIVEGNRVANCGIHHIGAEYEDSVGIYGGYVRGTRIEHNEIAHAPYSGISLGWGWGEEDSGGGNYSEPYLYISPTPARDNLIARNHIHEVMLRRDDGGGIYTLGDQPGTIIEGNHIHDAVNTPGGIYLDEGSANIEVRGNLVYNVPGPMNYNNRAQNRIETISEHDNFFDVAPDDIAVPKELAEQAGPRE